METVSGAGEFGGWGGRDECYWDMAIACVC